MSDQPDRDEQSFVKWRHWPYIAGVLFAWGVWSQNKAFDSQEKRIQEANEKAAIYKENAAANADLANRLEKVSLQRDQLAEIIARIRVDSSLLFDSPYSEQNKRTN